MVELKGHEFINEKPPGPVGHAHLPSHVNPAAARRWWRRTVTVGGDCGSRGRDRQCHDEPGRGPAQAVRMRPWPAPAWPGRGKPGGGSRGGPAALAACKKANII